MFDLVRFSLKSADIQEGTGFSRIVSLQDTPGLVAEVSDYAHALTRKEPLAYCSSYSLNAGALVLFRQKGKYPVIALRDVIETDSFRRAGAVARITYLAASCSRLRLPYALCTLASNPQGHRSAAECQLMAGLLGIEPKKAKLAMGLLGDLL